MFNQEADGPRVMLIQSSGCLSSIILHFLGMSDGFNVCFLCAPSSSAASR